MTRTCFKMWRSTGIALLTVLFSMTFLHPLGAQRHEEQRGEPNRGAGAPRGRAEGQRQYVERPYHGSVRHSDFGVVRREHEDVHRNYDVDVNHGWGRFWGGFVTGAIVGALPYGYQSVNVGGVPYYYADGTYYQQAPSGGYEVINPPAGATIPQSPPGSIPVVVGNQVYYYMDGTFYVQQGNGYVIVPAPLGVTVPELPSAATQVVVNGNVYYQFNGVYYQPIIQNGVTMYMTTAPQ
ncbi:MAG TPA: DUF6515 family protein [Verrucomicrobiae bacterium]|nr:DUF6515 family protein [Verrucomicrobiae bacterium]